MRAVGIVVTHRTRRPRVRRDRSYGEAEMSFAEFLHGRRRQLGLTVEDVARPVGVEPLTVELWETGARIPRPSRVEALEALLGVEPGHVARLLGYRTAED